MQKTTIAEAISVFDILKIGVGPSSSHTLGPWRAAENFITQLKNIDCLHNVERVFVNLYGSLALIGKGHGTDIAVILGLSGKDPETISPEDINLIPELVKLMHKINLAGEKDLLFNPETDIQYFKNKKLPFHSNGIIFMAMDGSGK